MNAKHIRLLVIALMVTGIAFFGKGIYIYAKARLAQYLLEQAWAEAKERKEDVKPWSWADTWPVARLIVPKTGEELIILEGCSGEALAFGPGHLTGTPLPGEEGNCVISGHRDTHFRFLKDLSGGSEIIIENLNGELLTFYLEKAFITDKNDLSVISKTKKRRLTLITCYPFNDLSLLADRRFIAIFSPKSE